ncbi:Inorganic pyrophosphatase [Nymphon striatum]|nr:Inorganic pyrophosphatase [Nymphon striatum]
MNQLAVKETMTQLMYVKLGYRVAKQGEVIQVKVLGTFALIDEGETDWKVLAIDVNDPMADKLNDIKDIHTYMPGFLKASHEWFKIYKMPDGKPPNKFAFDGEPKNKEFAENIIDTTHKAWKNLISNNTDKAELSCILKKLILILILKKMLITCVKSNDTINTVEDLKFTGILQNDLNCYNCSKLNCLNRRKPLQDQSDAADILKSKPELGPSQPVDSIVIQPLVQLTYSKKKDYKTDLIKDLTKEANNLKSKVEESLSKVAVDGGLNRLKEFANVCDKSFEDLTPDIVSGDFDSVDVHLLESFKVKGRQAFKTEDQNETDFTKSLRVISEKVKNREINVC